MNSSDHRINLIRTFAKKKAIEVLKENGLYEKGWRFEWNRRKKALGICSYKKKTIELSEILTPTQTVDDVIDTILHEVAHALTPGDGHGPKWKAVAKSLGCSGSVTGQLSDDAHEELTKSAPWIMVYNGRVIKSFFKKPTRTIRKLPTMYLRSCKEESLGKLRIIPNPEFKRV